MSQNLVIVESPAKCRTISKYLGKDYSVVATMGHIMDLPEKELGVDVEHDFKPKYVTSKGKRRVLKMLKDEAAKADTVYLAPDPDREGEAIAWHVAQTLAKTNDTIKRVMFNEITKKAVLAAIENPHEINQNKVNSQQARRILDRIVGYQVSPILWRTVFRGLSAGRVQSVALRCICEREEEIKAFKQEEYWSIQAQLGKGSSTFFAKLLKINGEKAELHNEQESVALIDRVKDKPFVVSDVQRNEKSRKPYPPFITSTLQQEAARKLGFSAAKTMVIAQQLYEGLELGAIGSTGLITYMRTDSTRIADEAVAEARNIITAMFDGRHIPETPRIFGKAKAAQDAHEAIRPAQVSLDFAPDKIKGFLSKDQSRLYDLVWKRFFASLMADAIFDSTRVDISAADCLFRSTGSIMKFDGFLALYDESNEETADSTDGENERLPDLKSDDKLETKDLIKNQHFTQPPPRYTEASLVRELEDKGIGRPSTYAQIIDTLKRRKYVRVDVKRFVPTEVGFLVKNMLVKEFAEIFDVGFTADMELQLDKVEDGSVEWTTVLKNFYQPFHKQLEIVTANIKNLRAQNQEVTSRTCPECNKFPLVVKWSKNGKFLACQGFPACKYTESLEKVEPIKTNEICEKCGAPMVILTIKGNRFLGCSKYPECRHTRSLSLGIKCPVEGCGGDIVERKTRKGKVFYGCGRYPACTFATWDEPVDKKCDACGYPILVKRERGRKGPMMRCPKCRTEYAIKTVGEGETAESAA
jgi:DNA topoisomerase I